MNITSALRPLVAATVAVTLAAVPLSSAHATASASVQVAAAVKAPSGVGATSSATRITVTWNKVSGATKYKVRLKDAGGATITTKTVSKDTLTHKFYGLTPKTKYKVSVAAYDASGQGPYSKDVDKSTKELAKPDKVATPSVSAVTDTSVTVSWGAKADVSTYQVEVLRGGTVIKSAALSAVKDYNTYADTQVTITGLPQYTDLQTRVRGVNSKGNGAWSDLRKFKTLATKITGKVQAPSVTAVSASSATFSWPSVTYAHSYTITIKQGTRTVGTYSTTKTTHTVVGLSSGTTYTATITAKNTTSSATGPASTFTTVPGKVTGVSATRDGETVRITWTAVTGAQQYLVTVTNASGAVVSSRTERSTTLTLTNLPLGQDLFVTVTAKNGSGAGSSSDKVKVVLPPPRPTGLRVHDVTIDTATVSWTTPTNPVDRYLVHVTDETARGKVVYSSELDGTQTGTTVRGLAWGAAHKVWVVAVGEGGQSAPATQSFTTKNPTRLTATMKATPSRTGKNAVRTTVTITAPGALEGNDRRQMTVTFDPVGTPAQTGATQTRSLTLRYDHAKGAYTGTITFTTKAHGLITAKGAHLSVPAVVTKKIQGKLAVSKVKKTSKTISAKVKVTNGAGVTVKVQKQVAMKWKTVTKVKVKKNSQTFTVKIPASKHRKATAWRVVLPENLTATGQTRGI